MDHRLQTAKNRILALENIPGITLEEIQHDEQIPWDEIRKMKIEAAEKDRKGLSSHWKRDFIKEMASVGQHRAWQ